MLQAHWRGYSTRREIEERTNDILAENEESESRTHTPQPPSSQDRDKQYRRKGINSARRRSNADEELIERRKQQIELWEKAATKIQVMNLEKH